MIFVCRRPVDWDKLEADLRKEEKEEKLDGDAGLQKLFQGIYAGADEVLNPAFWPPVLKPPSVAQSR